MEPADAGRLYSSAHFNDTFPQHTPPEVLNTPLEGVVLALKALSVDRVARFPFPTPPDAAALAAAQRCLEALGALDRDDGGGGGGGGLTAVGRAMARFPVGPRHARMILQVQGWYPAMFVAALHSWAACRQLSRQAPPPSRHAVDTAC